VPHRYPPSPNGISATVPSGRRLRLRSRRTYSPAYGSGTMKPPRVPLPSPNFQHLARSRHITLGRRPGCFGRHNRRLGVACRRRGAPLPPQAASRPTMSPAPGFG